MKENLMAAAEAAAVAAGEVPEKEPTPTAFIRKIRKKGCLEKE